MSTNPKPGPCPKCGAPLPIPDAVVCPGCDAILRPDPDSLPEKEEQSRRLKWVVLVGTTLAIFAVLNAWFSFTGNALLPLIPTGIYVLSFFVAARRVERPVPLLLLSLVFWLGFCALAAGIFFIGCLVVVSQGGLGG